MCVFNFWRQAGVGGREPGGFGCQEGENLLRNEISPKFSHHFCLLLAHCNLTAPTTPGLNVLIHVMDRKAHSKGAGRAMGAGAWMRMAAKVPRSVFVNTYSGLWHMVVSQGTFCFGFCGDFLGRRRASLGLGWFWEWGVGGCSGFQ